MGIPSQRFLWAFSLINKVSRERTDKTPWSQYGITLNGAINLDVPEEYRDTSNYCATLGHKCNHSFKNNARQVVSLKTGDF